MSIVREPCFWLTTTENPKPERERLLIVNGRKVIEKFPQHGHDGDYENKRKARGMRYVRIVRHEGHVVPLLLTNAAAHLDPSGPYGNYQRRKARKMGWYPAGGCPAALLAAGELDRDNIVSEVPKTTKPCKPGTYSFAEPCEHDKAERAARAAQWKTDQDERLSGFKTDADKHIEETRRMNKELVVDVASIIAEQMAQHAAAMGPAVTPKKP